MGLHLVRVSTVLVVPQTAAGSAVDHTRFVGAATRWCLSPRMR